MPRFVVGVDVGTASARAALFDAGGRTAARAQSPIYARHPAEHEQVQSSTQIWAAVCQAVRAALAQAGVDPAQVAGIGFDATCSLVVRGRRGEPLPVSAGEADEWDTVLWSDHRAVAQAGECTATGHAVLAQLGGVMSPEMQIPKLMWLKRHLPGTWQRSGLLFDLADFLTWRATGSLARSQCTLACKWTYGPQHDEPWDDDFLAAVGLADLREAGALPRDAAPVGARVGWLTPTAAAELGLTPQCAVASGLIDAHAGALGLWGASALAAPLGCVALIAGTSSCVMALSPQPRPVRGVWGPYLGAVVPGLWLNEGGQSATGALLDHVLRWHGAGGSPTAALHERVCRQVQQARRADPHAYAAGLHVLPDFHGNRSPLADADARGVISGLTLDDSFDSLCRLYWRTAVAIALGVRHVLDALNAEDYAHDVLRVAGGHLKNPLLMELYADATGCTLEFAPHTDAVLLGAAIGAASAAGLHADLRAAVAAMEPEVVRRRPDAASRRALDRDYRCFLAMHRHRRELDAIGACAAS